MGNVCFASSPEDTATDIFRSRWDRFLATQDNSASTVPLSNKWNHIHANSWAKSRSEDIKAELETKGIQSTFAYKVEGSERVGRAVVTCQVNNGNQFHLEITYEV